MLEQCFARLSHIPSCFLSCSILPLLMLDSSLVLGATNYQIIGEAISSPQNVHPQPSSTQSDAMGLPKLFLSVKKDIGFNVCNRKESFLLCFGNIR